MKKLLLCVMLLLGAALLLAACQGEQPSTDTNPDTSVATEPETEPESGDDTDATSEPATDPAEPETADGEVTSENNGSGPADLVMADVYPTPLEITYAGGTTEKKTVRLDEKAAAYAEALAAVGITAAEDGLPLTVTLRDMTADFPYGAEEGYLLTVTNEGITVEAQTDRGVHYAFMTLLQIAKDCDALPTVTVKDAPRNPIRGVIEGFYGTAWTHEYRKDLFKFMGENKMNAYIYAPKDDAKHRAQWRSRYTGAELERMTDLITTASENHVKFIYAISPGGDINLAGGYEADFQKLMAKCEQIYELGCRDFAIFLDDIPTLDAEGHAKLLNDFQTKFVETHEGMSDLIAITTEYTDPFLTAYTDKIAPLIHKDIELMWTGPGVVPASITNASLRNIIKKYNRNVLIWWNYPVNDVLVNNLYMGACEGLEKDLYNSITGLTANPMNQGYASMVPLFTTGDYLWNPEAYDQDASLKAACEILMPDAAEALLDFISMTCASPMNKNTDSAELKALLDAFKKDNNPDTRAALKAYFEGMVASADAILAANQPMVAEIREWIEKYRAYGEMGVAYMEMEEAFAAGKDMNAILPLLGTYKKTEASIANNPRLVSNFVMTPFLTTLTGRFSVLLGLSGEVTFTPAKPYTNCEHYEDFKADYMTDGDDSTYFWTAGTLTQAAGGKQGYFGVDLGEVMDVKNVYVATGVGGSDVLTKAAIEYSADGKKWTELYSGTCKAETLLSGLSVKARYIRMRGTDASNTSWTKVRAFEVNTSRTLIEDAPAASSGVTTSLPTYQTYLPVNMTDNDPNTYFWSGREGRAGDYIELDLGAVMSVTRIVFKSGVPAHSADYINNGELCYSADGTTWEKICAINGRDTVKDVAITARYIRVNIKANQTSWITVSEFSAVSEDNVSKDLALDEYFVPRSELLKLTDGHYVSYFAPDKAEGHTLSVRTGESGKVTLIMLALPENGLTVSVKDTSGKEIKTVDLTYITEIEAPAGSTVEIPLGNGLMPAEILW